MPRTTLIQLIVCTIVAGGCGRGASSVTFNKHVAPILQENCITCHRPGGDAPFSLVTFKDVVEHANEIGEETRARQMPPWMPEPGDVPLAGVRRLSDVDIDTLQRWIKSGQMEGDAADLRPAPQFASGWQLGTPDVVLTMPRPFVMKAGTEDVYRNVILPANLPNDVYVRAVELRTNGAPIHHALIRLARTSAARSRDGEDGQVGFSGMASESLQDPEGQFLAWAPGRGPMTSPTDMPWRLQKGSDLVIELHAIPSTRAVEVAPTIGLYLSSTPPARVPVTALMVSKLIDIPAGNANYVVTDRIELPVAVQMISVFPHAHYLGKEILVTATPPKANAINLLKIKRWDFHWQQDYRFESPVSLPRGTVIDMRFTYDNSAANPMNPAKPPVRVRVGNKSTDEMGNLGMQFVTTSPADALALQTAFFTKNVLANIAAGEARVRERSDSVEDLVLLGGAYVQAGRFRDALPHLQRAIRLDPRHAIAESYVGGAHMGLRDVASALAHFTRSAQLAPRDARAQFNLADALEQAGRRREAIAAFQRSVALDDGAFDAQARLGAALFAAGRVKESIGPLRRAVEIRPESADAESDLGGALAAAGFTDEAALHLKRALAIDPNHQAARQNLARLIGR